MAFNIFKGKETTPPVSTQPSIPDSLRNNENEKLLEITTTGEDIAEKHVEKVSKIHEEAQLLYSQVETEIEDLKTTIFTEAEKLPRLENKSTIDSQTLYNFYWHVEFHPLTRISEKVDRMLDKLKPDERTPMVFSPNTVILQGNSVPVEDIISKRIDLGLSDKGMDELQKMVEKQKRLVELFTDLRGNFTQYYRGNKYDYEAYTNKPLREIAEFDANMMKSSERS